MATISIGEHHLHKRRKKISKRDRKLIDKLAYLMAFFAPFIHIPQIFQIYYYENATGVSIISWAGFVVISIVWLFYGIIHKEKPLIIMYALLMATQIATLIGAIIY